MGPSRIRMGPSRRPHYPITGPPSHTLFLFFFLVIKIEGWNLFCILLMGNLRGNAWIANLVQLLSVRWKFCNSSSKNNAYPTKRIERLMASHWPPLHGVCSGVLSLALESYEKGCHFPFKLFYCHEGPPNQFRPGPPIALGQPLRANTEHFWRSDL